MLRKLDVGFAIVTLALGLYSVIAGISYGFQNEDGHPGSGFFPIVVGIALIGFSLINTLRSGVEAKQIKEVWSNQVAVRALVILGGHAVIIGLFTWIGLILSAVLSILLVGLTIAWGDFDKGFIRKLILVAVLAPLSLHLIFIEILGIQPKVGFLGF